MTVPTKVYQILLEQFVRLIVCGRGVASLTSSWLIPRYTKNEAGYKMLCTRISSTSIKNNLGTCTKLSPKIAYYSTIKTYE